jgi:hypothetical protein
MALIDELTQRISAEVYRTLDECIRHAVESYLLGDSKQRKQPAAIQRFARPGRRGQAPRKGSARTSRQNRSRTIINAVSKLGEATIEDVARATGLDKRGVGSSLYYLAEAGKLRNMGAGRYKALRPAKAA